MSRISAIACITLIFLALGFAVWAQSVTAVASKPEGALGQSSVWQRYELSGSNLQGITAVSANTAWAVGSDGLLARWDGATWTAYDNTTLGALSFNGVDALASNAAWAVADHSVAHWNGSAWVAEPVNTGTATLHSISLGSPTDGWAVGENLTGSDAVFARYNGTSWQQIAVSGIDRPLYAVDAVDITHAWAVGGRFGSGAVGKVVQWDGTNWAVVLSTTQVLHAVDMLDSTYGWAGGSGGSLWQWDGTNWTSFTPPSTGVTVESISVVSHTNAWAAGSANTMWHWDGTSWTTVPRPDEPYPVSIFMLDNSNGWAVGAQSTIYRWNGTAWTIATTRSNTNGYYALDFLNSNDGWAVGVVGYTPGVYGLQHWDGTTWQVSPAPSPDVILLDVDMVATDDVWAVGTDGYIFHWDGAAWSYQQSPGGSLLALSMVSATDGWAVGGNGSSGRIVHYNGTQWSAYPITTTTNISAIDMVSATEGWAGGNSLLLHYHNGTWSEVTLDPPASIEGIQMLDQNEGWAVGADGTILHYLNGFWVPEVNPATGNLNNIHMISPDEGWVAGTQSGAGGSILLHYLSGLWSIVPQPTGLELTDVYAFAPNDGWAVGSGPGVLLRLQDAPTPTATVTSTATSVPPTSTPMLTRTPTRTPTYASPTPTICTIQFSDVPQGSTFYSYIRCLSCRGILGGYTDGTFRPGNNVTRGQLAKIVANSAGFNDPAGQPRFEDVPPGSTFFDFVQRLANRDIMAGYPCGGVGEPCGGGNLPYFRPNSNATRGQVAKIVSNAAGFNENPGQQLFEDVPPANAFFAFVQRLANRDIMSGYLCGGVGEPCGPGELSYFRPNNYATRGQASKIISLTFFQDCPTP